MWPAPGSAGASRGECGEIGIDPDRHDGRFAAPVHHLGIGEYRGACDPSQPNKRIGRRLGRFLGRGIRGDVVCWIWAVGLRRSFRPEVLAGPAGADVIDQFNFECLLWRFRNCLSRRIVSHGFATSLLDRGFGPDESHLDSYGIWRIMLHPKSSTNRSRIGSEGRAWLSISGVYVQNFSN